MLNAARAQGRPTMVIAMMTAATSEPKAIHAPPRKIQRTFRSSDTGCIRAPAVREVDAIYQCSGPRATGFAAAGLNYAAAVACSGVTPNNSLTSAAGFGALKR